MGEDLIIGVLGYIRLIVETIVIAVTQQRQGVIKGHAGIGEINRAHVVQITRQRRPIIIAEVIKVPFIRVQVRQKRGQIDFPGAHPFIAQEPIIAGRHVRITRIARQRRVIINRIHIQRVPHRHGDERVAPDEMVQRPVRLVRMLQHPDPFRIANLRRRPQVREGVVAVEHPIGDTIIGVKHPVPVEVQVKAEIVVAQVAVRHKHRGARQVPEIRQVQLIITSGHRSPVRIVIIDVRGAGDARAGAGQRQKTVLGDVIGGDEHPKVVGVRGGEHGRDDLRFRRRQGGLRGLAGMGGVRAGPHRAAVAGANGQKRHRHDQCHRQHDQRDDQGDAPLSLLSQFHSENHWYAVGSQFGMVTRWRNRCSLPACCVR